MKVTYRLADKKYDNQRHLMEKELNSSSDEEYPRVQYFKDGFTDRTNTLSYNSISIGPDLDEPKNFKIRFLGHIGNGTYFFTISLSIDELLPFIGSQIKNLKVGDLLQSPIAE
tara:strand:+ start:126 stop:464 length:339 start_codon:yes stop_codon:yes gene_type:complete